VSARILVVDDSLLIRAVVRSNLQDEGYVVVEARDGTEALAACRAEAPDVVLLDVEMPGLDGYQVLAELKVDAVLQEVPVVFLTGRTSTEDIVTGLRAGAHDYLRKPFETAELLARVASAAHVKRLQDELRARNAVLEAMSRTDALTGLPNRRHLEEQLGRLHSDARRHGEPFCLLLLDIDRFKSINDTYGHPAGDVVLQTFAGLLTAQLRESDCAGRWGGEEFLALLPRTDLPSGAAVAARVRAHVEAATITAGDHVISATVSAGCVLGPASTVEALLQQVDVCLYEAKAGGRNRVVVGPGSTGVD
jgi:two-component system cell cycle response regulator